MWEVRAGGGALVSGPGARALLTSDAGLRGRGGEVGGVSSPSERSPALSTGSEGRFSWSATGGGDFGRGGLRAQPVEADAAARREQPRSGLSGGGRGRRNEDDDATDRASPRRGSWCSAGESSRLRLLVGGWGRRGDSSGDGLWSGGGGGPRLGLLSPLSPPLSSPPWSRSSSSPPPSSSGGARVPGGGSRDPSSVCSARAAPASRAATAGRSRLSSRMMNRLPGSDGWPDRGAEASCPKRACRFSWERASTPGMLGMVPMRRMAQLTRPAATSGAFRSNSAS